METILKIDNIEKYYGNKSNMTKAIDGISFGGVKFIIAKLQKKGLLKRVGGRKFGEWLVFI